ncbi:hypothetical protein, partial [Mesorhizobium sp.]|uniref:hypothetical protein n=1 Tax=Mesorhizobium sp. TaxID=1871066 RepID=UPI0025BDED93
EGAIPRGAEGAIFHDARQSKVFPECGSAFGSTFQDRMHLRFQIGILVWSYAVPAAPMKSSTRLQSFR